MKMSEAVIEWQPVADIIRSGNAAPGSVRVARKERGWSHNYALWLDIGKPVFSNGKPPDADADGRSVAQMFLDFHAMVVRDGIDPQTLHAELLKIDEYRQHISPDIKGAA